MSEEEEKIIQIGVFDPHLETFTVSISRFFYRIPKVNITVYRGYHTKEPNKWTGKTIEDAPDEDRLFSMTCRPRDMYHLAKTIVRLCESSE